MKNTAQSVLEYIAGLPKDRKSAIEKLTEVIEKNLPTGFEKTIGYGMLAFVVPHTIYLPGYHCDPKLPLPFISIASQKNFIALYHMGLYADAELLSWFTTEYQKLSATKVDIGKSCIRFKKPEEIPFELIGRLMKKINVEKWITIYEEKFK